MLQSSCRSCSGSAAAWDVCMICVRYQLRFLSRPFSARFISRCFGCGISCRCSFMWVSVTTAAPFLQKYRAPYRPLQVRAAVQDRSQPAFTHESCRFSGAIFFCIPFRQPVPQVFIHMKLRPRYRRYRPMGSQIKGVVFALQCLLRYRPMGRAPVISLLLPYHSGPALNFST